MTGIGAVVTRDVPLFTLVYGNPAEQHGWVDEQVRKLIEKESGTWESVEGQKYSETESGLTRK